MGDSFTPELLRLLVDAGCRFERHGKGDHDIWYSPIVERRFVVDAWRGEGYSHDDPRHEVAR
jgi:hypothetical protein